MASGPSIAIQETLPFSEARQLALLGHLLTNDAFFLQAKDKIEAPWFLNSYVSMIYTAKLKFYGSYKRAPSQAELAELFLSEETAMQSKLRTTVSQAHNQILHYQLDALTPELTDWMRARIYMTKIDRSSKLFIDGHLPDAYREMKEVTRQIDDIKFEKDPEFNFEDFRGFFGRSDEKYENALTFGLEHLDRLLLPSGKAGGLLPKDTTIMLAPTNVGKTTCLITVAGANVRRGKSVLFLSHEGSPDDIVEKVWCNMLDKSKPDVLNLYTTSEGQKKMETTAKLLGRFLTYIPFNKAGGTVEEVESIIRQKQMERVAKYGKGYDLLICDYPAKLTTEMARKGNMQHRHIESHVYNIFVQLALEYDFHSLLAIQTNREGSKMNRGRKGGRFDDAGESSRLLAMENVSESWGPMTTATNVISMNRDERAMACNRLTYYICKSRSNETGWAVVCHSNYANARTHDNKLGCAWYRSSHTMSEKIDELLTQWKNQSIPQEQIILG